MVVADCVAYSSSPMSVVMRISSHSGLSPALKRLESWNFLLQTPLLVVPIVVAVVVLPVPVATTLKACLEKGDSHLLRFH